MKVPRPPLTYSKEKGLTKRTVKGAAGGMQGVDYEDTRRPDMNAENAKAVSEAKKAGEVPEVKAAALARAEAAHETKATDRSAPAKDLDEMVLDDEDAISRDNKAKKNKRTVARDRLTVDKDAPHLKRNKDLWQRIDGDEEDTGDDSGYAPAQDPEEFDLEEIGEAIASASDAIPIDWARFEVEAPIIGDPILIRPDDIRKALGSPTAYAKHIVILTEAFRHKTGAHRQEAVAYAARMMVGVSDRNFGRSALRELGPGTGIVDVYPLEVLDHLIENYPAFLPKAGYGRIIRRGTQNNLRAEVGVPLELTHPPALLMRGFALTDDVRPGYRFEPGEDEGSYRLTFSSPGRHAVLVSGMIDNRYTIVDRFWVHVTGEGEPLKPVDRHRDEEAVEAWPQPEVPALDPRPWLEEEERRSSAGLLDSGEIVSRQQLDHLRGSTDENEEWEEESGEDWLANWSAPDLGKKILTTREKVVKDWLQDAPAGVLEDALKILAPPSTRVLEDAPVDALMAALDAIDPEGAADREEAPAVGEETNPEVKAYTADKRESPDRSATTVEGSKLGQSAVPVVEDTPENTEALLAPPVSEHTVEESDSVIAALSATAARKRSVAGISEPPTMAEALLEPLTEAEGSADERPEVSASEASEPPKEPLTLSDDAPKTPDEAPTDLPATAASIPLGMPLSDAAMALDASVGVATVDPMEFDAPALVVEPEKKKRKRKTKKPAPLDAVEAGVANVPLGRPLTHTSERQGSLVKISAPEEPAKANESPSFEEPTQQLVLPKSAAKPAAKQSDTPDNKPRRPSSKSLPLEMGPIPSRPFDEDVTEAFDNEAPGTALDDTFLRDGEASDPGFEDLPSDSGDDGLSPFVQGPLPLADTFIRSDKRQDLAIEPLVSPPKPKSEDD